MTDDDTWEGESRKFDTEFFTDYLGESLNDYTFMVAGPPDMAEATVSALADAGVKEENVNASRFSGY
jgi:NAD(P)H-flavin reductase